MVKHSLISAVLCAGLLWAQTPAKLEFEVARIKPAELPAPQQIMSGKAHIGMKVDNAQADLGFMSLRDLIVMAYRVKPFQVTGPDWLSMERFDILAKLPEGATKDQVPEMLKALLIDRFKLAAHLETKEQPVYALVVGKNGPKLKEAPPDSETPPLPAGGEPKGAFMVGGQNGQVTVSRDGKDAVVTGGPNGTMRIAMGPDGSMHFKSNIVSMQGLADFLTPMLDRPVVDETGLKGNYQVELDLSIEDMRNAATRMGVGVLMPGAGGGRGALGGPPGPADAALDPSGGTVFASVQKLGLKLEPRRAPVETLIVDHAEKTPTGN